MLSEIKHIPLPVVGRPGDNYSGLQPGSTVLPKGHRKHDNARALPTDMIWDRDVEVPMRDGTVLRADIYRPTGSQKVAVLLAWSPYGKSGAGMVNLDFMPGRAGIASSDLSGYEKFEAPDPAEWVHRGYAVAEVDSRGAFDSHGDIRFLGSSEGEDGYDAVEHIAQLPWCTGAVALAGNSWLGMVQYFIAAQHPPHLKCIAPLEGLSDPLRESFCRGGIPTPAFFNAIVAGLSGRGNIEDIGAMLEDPSATLDYWDDKRARMDTIKVPAYVLASFSTNLHTAGSIRCFEETAGPKWLTIHNTQEWHDLYQPYRTEDLCRFFDHYLRGIDNDWEQTPRIRVSLLGFNQPNITGYAAPDWPLPSTAYKRLYLSDSATLVETKSNVVQLRGYQSDFPAQQNGEDTEHIEFRYTFNERSYLLGHSVVEVFVSSSDSDDLDVHFQLGKADAKGNLLTSFNIPQADLDKLGMTRDKVPGINTLRYLGSTGMIRASRRAFGPESKPYNPMPSFGAPEKVTPGKAVKLAAGIWPSGIIFEAGEQLVLKIAGHPMALVDFPVLWGSHKPTVNKGKHCVHFGGEFESFVDVPFVTL